MLHSSQVELPRDRVSSQMRVVLHIHKEVKTQKQISMPVMFEDENQSSVWLKI